VARVYNFRIGHTTHQPVLFAVAAVCEGPIAECGCGYGSTLFLHEIAEERNVTVVSFETHADWLSRFDHLASANHEFRLIDSWEEELRRPEWTERWGLVFIDQGHWPDRVLTAKQVRLTADYVVLHDSSASPDYGLGRTIAPVEGPHARGAREYDEFSSWREFFPPEPWPNVHGPPTLLASNRFDVDQIDVDYERHLPLWWRVGRHARSLVPQPVRMRIANRIGWAIRPGVSTQKPI
jgi:hypothetical protein